MARREECGRQCSALHHIKGLVSMTTSPALMLRRPQGEEKIPEWMLNYVREHNQHRIHAMILAEFEKGGITQAVLAKRLGHKRADQICRTLRAPGNLEADTIAEILFACTGTIDHHRAIAPTAEAAIVRREEAPIQTDAVPSF